MRCGRRARHRLRAGRGEDRDKGGTIFDTDDRYLFQDTSFPWRIVGKVRTAGGWGSGTVIGPRHILTAVATLEPRQVSDLDQIPAMREWQKQLLGESFVAALAQNA